MKLWTAQSVSLIGANVSGFAIPTIAVTALAATPKQMALMTTAAALAFPLLGMMAATLVERWRKQRVMVLMDLGRMLAIASIPALAAVHRLTIEDVIAVSFVVAVMSVFHDIAYQAQLPAVVAEEQIGEGNTKLELSNSASQSFGPALAGVLMNAMSAPLALLVNAVSYLISAISIGSLRGAEMRVVRRPERTSFLEELWEGIRFIIDTPGLGRIALCTATINLAMGISSVVSMIFLYRVLHLRPVTVGLVFAFSNLGFVGALYAMKLSRKLGLFPTLSSAVLLNAFGRILLPAAALFFPVAVALVAMMITSLASPIYNVAQLSFRQSVTPLEIQARMHAAMRTVNSATAPLGALLGAALAESVGVQQTLVFAAFVTAAGAIWFLPVAHRRPAYALRYTTP